MLFERKDGKLTKLGERLIKKIWEMPYGENGKDCVKVRGDDASLAARLEFEYGIYPAWEDELHHDCLCFQKQRFYRDVMKPRGWEKQLGLD